MFMGSFLIKEKYMRAYFARLICSDEKKLSKIYPYSTDQNKRLFARNYTSVLNSNVPFLTYRVKSNKPILIF